MMQTPSGQAVVLARETMVGDLRDNILEILKHNHDALPWNMRGVDKQHEIIDNVTRRAEAIVERAVDILASDGRRVMTGKLESVAVKDGFVAKVKLSKDDPLRHALVDATGHKVVIVVAATDDYSGARGDVRIESPQRGLPFDKAKDGEELPEPTAEEDDAESQTDDIDEDDDVDEDGDDDGEEFDDSDDEEHR
jgi:hypothetical protein